MTTSQRINTIRDLTMALRCLERIFPKTPEVSDALKNVYEAINKIGGQNE